MEYDKLTCANGNRFDAAAIGLLQEADAAEAYAKAVRLTLLAGYSADFVIERVFGNVAGTDVDRTIFDVLREITKRLEAGLQSKFAGY